MLKQAKDGLHRLRFNIEFVGKGFSLAQKGDRRPEGLPYVLNVNNATTAETNSAQGSAHVYKKGFSLFFQGKVIEFHVSFCGHLP